MKKIISLFAFLLSLMLMTLCSIEEKVVVQEPYTLEISIDTVDLKSEATTYNVEVTTNMGESEWTAVVDDSGKSWCEVSKKTVEGKTSLVIAIKENDDSALRETFVTVGGEGVESKKIKIRQLGLEPVILLSKSSFNVDQMGEEVSFNITTNIDDLSIEPESWIFEKKEVDTRSKSLVSTTHKFLIKMNTSPSERTGNIIIKDKNSDKAAKVTIIQAGLDKYTLAGLDGIKDDIKVPVSKGKASSFQRGGEIEKSFDGDYSSIYHSNWDNKGENYFPITLTYFFNEAQNIDYMVYYPRQSGGNGHFIKTVIYAQFEGSAEFVKLMDKDFKGSGNATRVNFENSLTKDGEIKKYTAIRIEVLSGAGDGQGYAACAEMEFYAKNPDRFDPLELFTDITCSELKPGVTEQDIMNCKYPLYKKIAYFMLNGLYPKEFRIDEYKAYQHPDVQSFLYKTSPYSLLDNPTGIAVEEGEDLVVFAKSIANKSISIKVQDLDLGYGGPSYPLTDGFNKIKMGRKGLIYVMYHTDDYKTAAPVKLHFASGTVNGYFDKRKHKREDWQRLLNASTNKFFDVLGDYSHLTFPTDRFKKNTPDGLELINTYDEIVELEMDFMGLKKYNKLFRNRMYFHVVYDDSYMYSTAYRTAYNDETLDHLCNNRKTRETVWGPAHEVGHCNQLRPAIKWIGTTEVTNNIFAMYVQINLEKKSRLQDEKRYDSALNSMVVGGIVHGNEKSVFNKLVPFWQLYLYTNNVLKNADVYKDIYEDARNSAIINNDGQNQLDFVKRACDAARLNLIDFFTKWGFLREINSEIDDYSKRYLTITKDMLDRTVNEIKAKGYPEPQHPIEYITDNNSSVFSGSKTIVQGKAVRNGREIDMTNWQNAVAYEVFDGDKLIYVSTENKFTINRDFTSNTHVKAVAYNGDRIDVSF